jgi:hypothetical protein
VRREAGGPTAVLPHAGGHAANDVELDALAREVEP